MLMSEELWTKCQSLCTHNQYLNDPYSQFPQALDTTGAFPSSPSMLQDPSEEATALQ